MAEPMNAAEVALLNDRNGMFGGDGAFFWIFALLILAGGNFGGFGGGNVQQLMRQAQKMQEQLQQACRQALESR